MGEDKKRRDEGQKEESEAREKMDTWLKQEKFDGVNHKRKSMMKSKYPLHTAVKRQDQTMVQLLLRFEADPTMVDSNKQTPVAIAEKNNKDSSYDAIIRLLKA